MVFRKDFKDRPQFYEKLVKALVPYIKRLQDGDAIRMTDIHAICRVAYASYVTAARKQELRLYMRKYRQTLIRDILEHINALPPASPAPKRKRTKLEDFRLETKRTKLRQGRIDRVRDANNFMHAAVKNGDVELVEELLKSGAQVNKFYNSTLEKDSTPLHVTTKNRHVEVAKLLISYGADVNALDETEKTPIFHAIKNADLKMIKLLLANKANVIDNPVLLNMAIMTESSKIIEIIFQHGADVNANEKCGRIPLYVIVFKEKECSRLNLNLDHHDIEYVSRFFFAEGIENSIVNNSMILFTSNINRNYINFLQSVTEDKYNFGFICKSVITPLHVAILLNNMVIIKLILSKGGNVNALDDKNFPHDPKHQYPDKSSRRIQKANEHA